MDKAILILLNGINQTDQLKESSILRCEEGLRHYTGGEHIIVSTGYTTNKPPLIKQNGFIAYEADVAANYLFNRGVEKNHIWTETFSKDTIGNIYFSNIFHLLPLGIKDLAIVTSSFHMQRVKLAAEWIFGLFNDSLKMRFVNANDPIYEEAIFEELKAKELKSCENILQLSARIDNRDKFHRWLFREHQAYTLNGKTEKLNDLLIKTY